MIVAFAFAIVFVLGGCWFAWKIGRDWKAGTVKVLGGFVDRTDNPGRYYFNIAIQAVAMMAFFSVPLFVLLALRFPECASNPVIRAILSCPYAAH